MFSNLVYYYLFLACLAICYSEETQNDVKVDPLLPKAVKNWAERLGGELWHFGELVTRRNKVIDSYKHEFSVKEEDGEGLLKDITDEIKQMMEEKVAAVRRIMEVAEHSAVSQSDDIDENFDFYDMKNLINSALPEKENEEDGEEEEDDEEEEVRDDDDENSTLDAAESISQPNTFDNTEIVTDFFKQSRSKFSRMIHPEESEDYQQDEEPEQGNYVDNSEDTEEDDKQEPMASLKPPEDKRRMPLFPNRHFYNISVNMNRSAVHVPSNVYAGAKEVIKGIKWSEELDETFRHNYKQDPTLSFQYFGSSTGFMRQYPSMIWPQGPLEVDLYDCRMRSWFSEAASSPKDMVILVDRSGSMTGMRREIAKHVVTSILDTLGDNDFVNVYTFSNTTTPLVECFEGNLVQAHLGNVRVLKGAMGEFKTEQIANFTLALSVAFELLQEYRDNRPGLGAQCNQAIMLVTDGVQYNFKEVFEKYNWNNLPFMPVRVFTYLIGREVSDVREVKWMACANQGYYVHLSTYAEVREQVLQYLPVMARPMVLNPTLKPHPAWSPVYADIDDPKLTDYLWAKRREQRQLNRFLMYRKNRTLPDDNPRTEKTSGDNQKYNFMSSVSLPVYDKRQNANITETIQINEKIWISVTRETRVANLLGVAGTDIPIELITKLMLPHRLGVNGYAFIVTNNGYLLTHPDLRPTFQGILKPSYNRVDMMEVEIPNDDSEPREFSEALLAFRKAVVMQQTGKKQFDIKAHMDNMRRVTKRKRYYFYKGIENTPFTVVVSLPEKYGLYRIQPNVELEPHRMRSNSKDNFTMLFSGPFTIHPDWKYCSDNRQNFDTPEEELKHFLSKMTMPGWTWPACDSKLIHKVIADAKFTQWFNDNISDTNNDENGHTYKRFGITVAFLATHSGLTRWQDFLPPAEYTQEHFHVGNSRAIDEIWYRRAVDQYYVNERSFVYSVPADVTPDDLNHTVVTASHAIYKKDKITKNETPAAVVGFQFYHSALRDLFIKTTSTRNISLRTCESRELDCLLVDDSGYILVSYKENSLTGQFFGDYRPDLMEKLVEENIYTRTRMYDYQATCFPQIQNGNAAGSILKTPFVFLCKTLQYLLSTIVLFAQMVFSTDVVEAMVEMTESQTQDDMEELPAYKAEKELQTGLLINKTNPEGCDAEFWLYSLVKHTEKNISNSGYNRSISHCDRPFLIQPVGGSNLVMIVISVSICPVKEDVELASPTSLEIPYNDSLPCYLNRPENILPRRHYMSCINRSIHENEIVLCGRSPEACTPQFVILLILLLNVLLLL